MQIAKYFATFGVKIDPNALKKLDAVLKRLEKLAKTYHARIDNLEDKSTNKKVDGLKKVEKETKKSNSRQLRENLRHRSDIFKANLRLAKMEVASIERLNRRVRRGSASHTYRGDMSGWLPYQSSSEMSSYYSNLERSAERDTRRDQRVRLQNEKAMQRRVLAIQNSVKYFSPEAPAPSAANLHNAHTQLYQQQLANQQPLPSGRRFTGISSAARLSRKVGGRVYRGIKTGASAGFLSALPFVPFVSRMTDAATDMSNNYYGVESTIKSFGGSEADAKKLWTNMKNFSQEVGSHFSSSVNPMIGLMSPMLARGQSVDDAFNVYKELSKFSVANHLDQYRMGRLFLGMSQFAGKGQLEMQEYRQQILENAPAIGAPFMRAFGQMLLAKGDTSTYAELNSKFITKLGDKNIDMTKLAESFFDTFEKRGAGRIQAETFMPFLLTELSKMSSLGLPSALHTAQAERNRAYNKAAFQFDPNTEEGQLNLQEIRDMWVRMGDIFEKMLPALMKFSAFLVDAAVPIIEFIADKMEIDLNARAKLEKRVATAMSTDTTMISTPSTMGLGGGEVNVNTGERIAALKGYYDYARKLDPTVYDDWQGFSTWDDYYSSPLYSSERKAFIDKALKSGKWKYGDTSEDAAKTIVKPKSDSGFSMTNPQASAGSVFNGDIYVTTDDAKSFNSDLLRTVSQFNGIEKTGVV